MTFSKNFRREQNNFPNPSIVYPFLMILFSKWRDLIIKTHLLLGLALDRAPINDDWSGVIKFSQAKLHNNMLFCSQHSF